MGTNGAAPVRVLVVDDHESFAEALAAALDVQPDMQCVGRAPDADTAVTLHASLRPDVTLMDVNLQGADGWEATTRILEADPAARVVILTASSSAHALRRAAHVGAVGFVSKVSPLAGILTAIRRADSGSLHVGDETLRAVADGTRNAVRLGRLSARELDVLSYLANGHDVQHISRSLHISSSTTRGYVKSILAKFGAHTQLEAVVMAVRAGIVDVDRGVGATDPGRTRMR